MDYTFQIATPSPPFSPQKKSEKGCLWGRGQLYTAFRAANAFRVTWSEQVFFLRYALTEIVWEEAVQGLGMAMSTVASGKNRKLYVVYQ